MCLAEKIQQPESAAKNPKLSQQTVVVCTRCNELKTELELERTERRELSTKNRKFWKENSDLRERCATFEERMACSHSGQ